MPGLTGPWQVEGRSALDYERMVELDCDYVANHSTGRDLGIIARTVLVVVLGRGASTKKNPGSFCRLSILSPARPRFRSAGLALFRSHNVPGRST